MALGRISHFGISAHYRNSEVLAGTPPPVRLVDGLPEGTHIDDGELFREVVGTAFDEFDSWIRLRTIGRMIVSASASAFNAVEMAVEEPCGSAMRMPQDWIGGFLADHERELRILGIPTEYRELNNLAFCLAYARKNFDGVPLTAKQCRALGTNMVLSRSYLGKVSKSGPCFQAMLVPTDAQAAALAVLLAATHVNAQSISTIRPDCLSSGHEPGVSLLTWDKPRARDQRHELLPIWWTPRLGCFTRLEGADDTATVQPRVQSGGGSSV